MHALYLSSRYQGYWLTGENSTITLSKNGKVRVIILYGNERNNTHPTVRIGWHCVEIP